MGPKPWARDAPFLEMSSRTAVLIIVKYFSRSCCLNGKCYRRVIVISAASRDAIGFLILNPAVRSESGGQEGDFRPRIACIVEPVTENEAKHRRPASG